MEHNLSWKRMKERLTSRRGMTLMELMIVVAIVAILGGVSFIAVWNYQRSLAQVERDGIAKEIFVAAQNHLTTAQGQGYLGKTGYGTPGTYTETVTKDGREVTVKDSDNKVYYYAVTNGKVFGGGEDAFNLMLPFGSIDETIRAGGSYLIRYQPETATVLDVFYCSTNGSPTKFNHSLQTTEYGTVMGLRNDKNGRKTYTAGNDSVLGYYGGAEADTLATLNLKAPTIKVENEDKLRVIVTDAPTNSGDYSLKLIITGELSGAQKAFTLKSSDPAKETLEATRLESGTTYTIILDDITTSGLHFCEIEGETNDPNADPDNPKILNFIPGENITVQAVAYSITELANVAYSTEKKTNSLFADGTTTTTAQISSIRHLENLDKTISNLDKNDNKSMLNISSAVQIADLDWEKFNGGTSTKIYGSKDSSGSIISIGLTNEEGYYYPIQADYLLSYDGKSHSISNIKADSSKIENDYSRPNAGLFGSITSTGEASSITNLELIDFSITGSATAGALAGSLTNCNVTNVLARNSSGTSTATGITASSGSAGGLIGSVTNSSTYQIKNSAAALIVSGSTTAGGLIGQIGQASGTITGCYSGGHTDKGEYYTHTDNKRVNPIYNVTGATAGGLVGNAGSATISNSYSTCSVYGTTVGGFVGSASGKITKSYCTGLVNGENNAFIGSGTLADNSTDNLYYKIVNEKITFSGTGAEKTITAISYKDPGREGITPIEDNFNVFVGDSLTWTPAKPYDITLASNYGGLFNLKTVEELGASVETTDFVKTHYGDWPSPELFYTNTPA